MASRCWKDYFTAVFLLYSTPNLKRSLNGSQPNLDTYLLMIAIWKIWSKQPWAFTPTGWRAKTAFGDRLWPLTEHISATKHDINNRKKTCQSIGTSLHAPNLVNFGPETAENGWRDFVHPLNFRIGRHCRPYRMNYRQQANVRTCYVVAQAYSLEQQNAWRAHGKLCHASSSSLKFGIVLCLHMTLRQQSRNHKMNK